MYVCCVVSIVVQLGRDLQRTSLAQALRRFEGDTSMVAECPPRLVATCRTPVKVPTLLPSHVLFDHQRAKSTRPSTATSLQTTLSSYLFLIAPTSTPLTYCRLFWCEPSSPLPCPKRVTLPIAEPFMHPPPRGEECISLYCVWKRRFRVCWERAEPEQESWTIREVEKR